MTESELKILENTISFFGSWYDVIGLDKIKILEKSLVYIQQLKQENEKLKSKLLSSNNNVFAELNDETARSNAELMDKVEDLEKENKDLKEELKKWKEEHHEQVLLANEEGWNRTQLQIENGELKKDKDYLDKVNNEQTEVILKLNEQNEKMKCCQNCELYDCTLDCKHTKCKYQYSEMCRDKTMNDKWELKKNER